MSDESNEDPLGMNEMEEGSQLAVEREQRRDHLRSYLDPVLEALGQAEVGFEKQHGKSSWLYELAAAKLSVLKIKKEIDEQSNEVGERNLLAFAQISDA